MLRQCVTALALTLFVAGAPVAEAKQSLPISTVNGNGLSLVGAGAELDAGVVHTSGWVRRDVGRYSVDNAHLHVIFLDRDGATLQVVEARWNGVLRSGPRSHRTVRFHVRTPVPEDRQVASVRVTVESGPRHD